MNSSKINFLSKSSILITGGTGSFGKAFVEKTLKKYPEVKITIFSRDEMKQWDMALEYKLCSCLSTLTAKLFEVSFL